MISIIIPTYNEEKVITDTLEKLSLQTCTNYEVIIVDGGSSDNTIKKIKKFPEVTLMHGNKGRAVQMNLGANKASGDWLLFLHADTTIPHHAIEMIHNLMEYSEYQAGGFKHQFSDSNWRLKLISHLNNYRCQKTRVIFGDQAMFINQELFDSLGGFPEQPILEDLSFSRNLLAYTQPILLDEYAITDSRKFTSQGIWRSFYQVANILLRVRLGMSVTSNYQFFTDAR